MYSFQPSHDPLALAKQIQLTTAKSGVNLSAIDWRAYYWAVGHNMASMTIKVRYHTERTEKEHCGSYCKMCVQHSMLRLLVVEATSGDIRTPSE